METLYQLQRWLNDVTTGNLSAFANNHDWAALAAVLPLGVLFGASHALTLGHGRACSPPIWSADAWRRYALPPQRQYRRQRMQGLAVFLALLAAPFITRTLGGVGRAPALKTVSRGLLIVLGAWLIVRVWRGRSHAHGEGLMMGVVAGLLPCPLTLFAMFFALARGVPEAGVAFALAMMGGVGLTLTAVALLTVLARGWVVGFMGRHGASIDGLSRWVEGLAGAALMALAAVELAQRQNQVDRKPRGFMKGGMGKRSPHEATAEESRPGFPPRARHVVNQLHLCG